MERILVPVDLRLVVAQGVGPDQLADLAHNLPFDLRRYPARRLPRSLRQARGIAGQDRDLQVVQAQGLGRLDLGPELGVVVLDVQQAVVAHEAVVPRILG
ncbi:hypothetical protein PG997_009129 [Apiospora hydei]|uniref:Uncharacterized protein n=1 Tax=Apiospora hydei TaxID=1337664 RepID=A0ABR1VVW8_9PEZI